MLSHSSVAILFGIAFGAMLGIILGNLAVGIAAGTGLGIAFGAFSRPPNSRKSSKETADEAHPHARAWHH